MNELELQSRHETKACSIDSGPKKGQPIYWVARKLTNGRWQFQDGWDTAEKAVNSTKFYRRTFHKAATWVKVLPGQNKAQVLREQLANG